jgi:predicted Mrr-cat superfamily restriction endonuclease
VLGEVTGPYREVPGFDGPPHRRDVRWYGEVPRAAVRPVAQLQDPRALFQVRLSEGAAAVPGRGGG